jgi:hypothetical protein
VRGADARLPRIARAGRMMADMLKLGRGDWTIGAQWRPARAASPRLRDGDVMQASCRGDGTATWAGCSSPALAHQQQAHLPQQHPECRSGRWGLAPPGGAVDSPLPVLPASRGAPRRRGTRRQQLRLPPPPSACRQAPAQPATRRVSCAGVVRSRWRTALPRAGTVKLGPGLLAAARQAPVLPPSATSPLHTLSITRVNSLLASQRHRIRRRPAPDHGAPSDQRHLHAARAWIRLDTANLHATPDRCGPCLPRIKSERLALLALQQPQAGARGASRQHMAHLLTAGGWPGLQAEFSNSVQPGARLFDPPCSLHGDPPCPRSPMTTRRSVRSA